MKEILFKTKDYYDQIIISSDDNEFRVHKSVISQFHLFKTFFNEKEKVDYDQKTLNLFLELIYLGQVSIEDYDMMILMNLYPLLDQHSMNENIFILKEMIQSKINQDNILNGLEFYENNQINDDKLWNTIEGFLNNCEIEQLFDAYQISENYNRESIYSI